MKTCPSGHAMDGASDWYQVGGSLRRQCSECRRQQQNARYQKRKEARAAEWNERLEQLVDAYGVAAAHRKYETREALLDFVRESARASMRGDA